MIMIILDWIYCIITFMLLKDLHNRSSSKGANRVTDCNCSGFHVVSACTQHLPQAIALLQKLKIPSSTSLKRQQNSEGWRTGRGMCLRKIHRNEQRHQRDPGIRTSESANAPSQAGDLQTCIKRTQLTFHRSYEICQRTPPD